MNNKPEISITAHAYRRGKERLGYSRKTLERIAVKAFTEGVLHRETKGQLNKFVTKIYLQYCKANNIRIYGENIFLFIDAKLITVYQVPVELRNHIKCIKK